MTLAGRAAALLAAAAAALSAAAPAGAATWPDLTRFVDPFIGTDSGAPDFGTGGGAGGTFPGAVVPFGMAQFGPDTLPSSSNFAAGYSYPDRRLRGFSLTHFSGAGCAVFQDFPMTPLAVPVRRSPAVDGSSDVQPEFAPALSHRVESAAPGRYAVLQDPGTPRAVRSELTATTRTGVARFTYRAGADAGLIVNAGASAIADDRAQVRISPDRREISGSAASGRFCLQPSRYRVYFAARFSRPFKAYGTWREQQLRPGSTDASDVDETGTGNYKPLPGGPPFIPGNPSSTAQAGAYVSFDTGDGRVVEAQVAVSFTSLAGARRNLRAERIRRGFDAAAGAARARWGAALGRAAVRGGTRRDLTLYATSLYHALLHPNVISDADGRYLGMDGRVRRAADFTKYANVSGWDVYRSQTPLMAMLFPDRASDVVASLLADARESGCLPRWPYANQQTNVMVGDPSDPIIAGAYALGARDFDARGALKAMVRGATRRCYSPNGDYTEREALPEYLRLGYVPQELDGDVARHTLGARSLPWGAAATTLEYALADFSIARLARALGRPRTAIRFLRRSANWRRLVNPRTEAIQPRFATGAFLAPFDPASGVGYVEGNGAQYGWFVPHDPAGLFASMGGRAAAGARLDRFFSRLNAGPARPYAFLGNEPSLATPWLFDWLGRPWRTQDVVRRAMLGLYRPTPGGMPGNDDGGTMSAWWVFAALGLYPAVPGTDVLALNSPLFHAARLRLPGGVLRIDAPAAARARPFVRSLRLSGRELGRPWLRYAELVEGGRLRFALQRTPDRSWGAAPAAAPPSHSSGRIGFPVPPTPTAGVAANR